MAYPNDAAPNLIFDRKPQYLHTLSEKKYTNVIKKIGKDLEKYEKKATKEGINFKIMSGNLDFEAAFNCINRNNEIEYRMLFTPLAQKQMTNVIQKSYKNGLGDTFRYIKMNKANLINSTEVDEFSLKASEHLNYSSYDIDLLKEKFINYQKNYFKAIYGLFEPILSIPLIQQTGYTTNDEIMSDDNEFNDMTLLSMINKLPKKLTSHPKSGTPNIISIVNKNKINNYYDLHINADGFETIERIDYIPKMGGDGAIHNVPVP
ncbi:UNVERIFIED_CONTAM: hypothetical protein O8I53_07815 [Campylobacter lari]